VSPAAYLRHLPDTANTLLASNQKKMSTKRGLKVCNAGIKPGKAVNNEAMEAVREVGD